MKLKLVIGLENHKINFKKTIIHFLNRKLAKSAFLLGWEGEGGNIHYQPLKMLILMY